MIAFYCLPGITKSRRVGAPGPRSLEVVKSRNLIMWHKTYGLSKGTGPVSTTLPETHIKKTYVKSGSALQFSGVLLSAKGAGTSGLTHMHHCLVR